MSRTFTRLSVELHISPDSDTPGCVNMLGNCFNFKVPVLRSSTGLHEQGLCDRY